MGKNMAISRQTVRRMCLELQSYVIDCLDQSKLNGNLQTSTVYSLCQSAGAHLIQSTVRNISFRREIIHIEMVKPSHTEVRKRPLSVEQKYIFSASAQRKNRHTCCKQEQSVQYCYKVPLFFVMLAGQLLSCCQPRPI